MLHFFISKLDFSPYYGLQKRKRYEENNKLGLREKSNKEGSWIFLVNGKEQMGQMTHDFTAHIRYRKL